MINTAIDYHRKFKNSPDFQSIENTIEPFISTSDNNYLLDEEEIMALVQSLSPVYRIVFSMSVVDGYSHTEIANKLKCTESAVRANLSKAKAKLKEKISHSLMREHKY